MEKRLILKIHGTTYNIDIPSIKYDMEKFCIVVSGIDNNGMYYQIKLKRLEPIIEYDDYIKMKGN